MQSKMANSAEQKTGKPRWIWQSIARYLLLVLIVSGLTVYVNREGWLRGVEDFTLDVIANTSSIKPSHCLIIEIDDQDYKTIFKSKSPVAPEQLRLVVAAVARGNPAVIVIDFDTTFDSVKNLSLPAGCTVIFARLWDEVPAMRRAALLGVSKEQLDRLSMCQQSVIVPRSDPSTQFAKDLSTALRDSMKETQYTSALAFFPRDGDGCVRRYCRRVRALSDERSGPMSYIDTLPWATAKAYTPDIQERQGKGGELNEVFLSFARGRYPLPTMSAGTLFQTLGVNPDDEFNSLKLLSPDSDDINVDGWRNLVEGKVVLIGSTFEANRDLYKTAIGKMHGVKLIAQAVETELQGRATKPVNEKWLWFWLVIVSFVSVVVNERFNRTLIPVVGLFAIPFIALILSLVAFNTMALWANFAPLLFAVQFAALLNHINNVHKRNVELKEKVDELAKTQKELARAIDVGSQRERERVANTLHDETLMHLFELETRLNPLRKSDQNSDVYEQVLDALQKTRKNVREVMNDLYPSALKDQGLVPALQSLAQSLSNDDLRVSVRAGSRGDLGEVATIDSIHLSDADLLRLYNIVQNALRNVVEHARATECEILVLREGALLKLEIHDNGKGIESLEGRSDSRGVRNMREYADLLDATIEWISPSSIYDKGTSVVLCLAKPE